MGQYLIRRFEWCKVKIESIELKNFRNYTQAHVQPCDGVTVFTGDNAQGKTNILESVYLCCTGRSHRTPRDKEMIRSGETTAYIKVSGRRNDGRHDVEMALSTVEKRRIKVNGTQVSRSGELLGHITGVLFAPEDLRMVKDGPAMRRHFIDMELSQLRPRYYYALQRYARALKQRGALLRECAVSGKSPDMLDIWDNELSQSGSEIMTMRAAFVRSLAMRAEEIHAAVADNREKLRISYEPDVMLGETAQETAQNIQNALLRSRASDIKHTVTGAGPHRDDMGVFVNDMDARAFGSQGQVRTCALSLKLSEIEIMKQESGESPVLMLDDVMSELDPSRRRLLIGYLEGVQTFVTCTDRDDLAGAQIGKLIKVKSAILTEEN